jgi:hypothetical protein
MTLKTDFIDGDYLYAGTTSDTDKLNGITNTINAGSGILGEVRMFALSISGAVTKSTLQGYGWAICDGTTPSAQGISDADITTTPNLEHKFIRMSDDETSGTTGGEDEHNHQWLTDPAGGATSEGRTWESDGSTQQNVRDAIDGSGTGDFFIKIVNENQYYTKNTDTKPPYYEMAFFIKVK